ncbi:MAG: hypothetical protein ACR2P5_01030 [Gammaproteobacteria bacterium]
MHVAANNRCAEAETLLRKCGADPALKDRWGNTPETAPAPRKKPAKNKSGK